MWDVPLKLSIFVHMEIPLKVSIVRAYGKLLFKDLLLVHLGQASKIYVGLNFISLYKYIIVKKLALI